MTTRSSGVSFGNSSMISAALMPVSLADSCSPVQAIFRQHRQRGLLAQGSSFGPALNLNIISRR